MKSLKLNYLKAWLKLPKVTMALALRLRKDVKQPRTIEIRRSGHLLNANTFFKTKKAKEEVNDSS